MHIHTWAINNAPRATNLKEVPWAIKAQMHIHIGHKWVPRPIDLKEIQLIHIQAKIHMHITH